MAAACSNPLFPLTAAPAFNEVVQACEAISKGQDRSQLNLAIDNARQFFRVFADTCAKVLEARPETAATRAAKHVFASELRCIHEILDELESCPASETQTMAEALEDGRQAIDSCFQAIAQLTQEDQARPKLSRSPLLDELLHLSESVARGQVRQAVLDERAAAFSQAVQRYADDLGEWTKELSADDPFSERIDELEQAIIETRKALRELPHAADRLQKWGELLVDFYLELEERFKPKGSPTQCPRCGHASQDNVRFCPGCNNPMPGHGLPQSHFEIKDEPERPEPANVVRLEQAILSYEYRTISREQLYETVQWFADKIDAGAAKLASLPDDDPMKQLSIELDKAVDEIALFFEDGDEEHLREGLEMVREGARRFQAMVDEALMN